MSTATTFTTFASLQNDSSATTDLNTNFAAVNTALANTLALNGQSPNQMQASLDMNSNRVINLPAPVSNFEPIRFVDASTLGSGGSITVNPLPVGGTTGQLLSKNSATNFDVGWTSPSASVNVTAGKTLSVTNSLTLSGTDGTTMTFPSTSGSVSTASNTETLTNKTLDTAGTGNVLKINGTAVNSTTGSGAAVLASAPTLVSPTITSSLSATNLVSNGNLAQAGSWTFKGNNTGSTANVNDFTIDGLPNKASPAAGDEVIIWDVSGAAMKKATVSSVGSAGSVTSIDAKTGAFTTGNGIDTATNVIEITAARRTLPTRQTFVAGSSLTYTTPANCLLLKVRMVGGGGGGGANGGSGLTGAGGGGVTTFNSINANGGGAGSGTGNTGGGAGGSAGTGGTGVATLRIPGQAGIAGSQVSASFQPTVGGQGGSSLLGFGANVVATGGGLYGGGGGGAGTPSVSFGTGGGGGGGEYVELIIPSPAANYTYTVGAAGTGGGGGAGGATAAGGAAGIIIVDEYYNA